MSKTIVLPLTCGCKKQKAFTHSLEVEDATDPSVVHNKMIECPFPYEKQCVRHIKIELPAGKEPKKDQPTWRNG